MKIKFSVRSYFLDKVKETIRIYFLKDGHSKYSYAGAGNEAASKRINELVNLVDDLKTVLGRKNEDHEKQLYKIELMEQEKGIRIGPDDTDDDF